MPRKLSVQRQAILEFINSSNQHLDADALARGLADQGHPMGLATVYRGLAALEEARLIESIQLEDKKVYERADKAHHDHIVCTACGRIEEFVSPVIESIQEKAAKDHGFSMTGHQLMIFGVCSSCQSSMKQ